MTHLERFRDARIAPDRACVVCQEARRLAAWPAGWSADAVPIVLVSPDGAPQACAACLEDFARRPDEQARRQVVAALDSLARPARDFVRWPFASLDALTGPLAPGTVTIAGAASGGGKTTFVTSAIAGWIADGVRVAVAPLELEPWDWRKQMAAVRAEVMPGDVLSGELLIREQAGEPWAGAALDRVRAELRAMQAKRAHEHGLYVIPDRTLSVSRLARVFAHAAEHDYRVVVIDHLDHVADDDGRSGLDESKAVNQAVAALAQEYGRVVLATSQLNARRFQGKDRLAKYQPPESKDLYLHTFKEHVATHIVGLFRPVVPDADADALSKARDGSAEPMTVLAPNTMGVVYAKSRNYGSREGRRAFLTVDRGAARERTDDEVRAWEGARHGIHAITTPNGLRMERGAA